MKDYLVGKEAVAAWAFSLMLLTSAARADGLDDAKAGLSALEAGNYPSAISLFTRAIAADSLSKDDLELAYVKRAEAYAAEHQTASALADLDKARTLNPSDQEADAVRQSLQAPPTSPARLTPAVAQALRRAQDAMNAKDYSTALSAVQEARSVPGSTSYDTFMTERFALVVEVNRNDMVAATADAEAAADSDPATIPDSDKAAVYKAALQLAANAKQYDKAVRYAHALAATNPPPDAQTQTLIGQVLYMSGDTKAAEAFAGNNIAAATAAGGKPDRRDLEIRLAAQVKEKNEAGAEETLETLVKFYDDPADWEQMISVSMSGKGIRDLDMIYLGRLLFAGGANVSAADASLIGNVAGHLGFYGDVLEAKKRGGTGLDALAVSAAADRGSLPAQISAEAGNNGEYNVKLAEALYGYGMYVEAETAARVALRKGGTKDPAEPYMVLGMALAAQGKNAEASDAFNHVSNNGPASQRVVRLWTYYVNH